MIWFSSVLFHVLSLKLLLIQRNCFHQHHHHFFVVVIVSNRNRIMFVECYYVIEIYESSWKPCFVNHYFVWKLSSLSLSMLSHHPQRFRKIFYNTYNIPSSPSPWMRQKYKRVCIQEASTA